MSHVAATALHLSKRFNLAQGQTLDSLTLYITGSCNMLACRNALTSNSGLQPPWLQVTFKVTICSTDCRSSSCTVSAAAEHLLMSLADLLRVQQMCCCNVVVTCFSEPQSCVEFSLLSVTCMLHTNHSEICAAL